jgi:hypothetical protein
MSRDDGFTVMDVSTAIHEDAKFKRLARRLPELLPACFTAYVALLAESWRAGGRVALEDAWPALLGPYNRAVAAALRRFKLTDRAGQIAPETWERWFNPAQHRQEQARDRWRRANEKRHAVALRSLALDSADTAELPRGNRDATATTVPSVRPSVPSDRVEGAFDGPGDDLQSLLASWGVIGLPLGPKLAVRLDGLVEDHGTDAVRAQFDRLHKAGSKEAGQYVLGACNSLRPIPKKAPDDNSEAIERTRREYPGPVWYPPVKPNGRKPAVVVTDPDTDYDAGMSRDGETKSEPQALAPADWFERPGA